MVVKVVDNNAIKLRWLSRHCLRLLRINAISNSSNKRGANILSTFKVKISSFATSTDSVLIISVFMVCAFTEQL